MNPGADFTSLRLGDDYVLERREKVGMNNISRSQDKRIKAS
jgi:hypothetical protein